MVFTKELANYLKNTDVRVNAIHPGIVKTNIAQSDFSLQGLAFKLLKNTIAINPETAAERILAIVSDEEYSDISGAYISQTKTRKPHTLVNNLEARKEFLSRTIRILNKWLVSEEREIKIPSNLSKFTIHIDPHIVFYQSKIETA